MYPQKPRARMPAASRGLHGIGRESRRRYSDSSDEPITIRIAAIVIGGTPRKAILPVGISPAHTIVTSVNSRNARVSRDTCMKTGTVAENGGEERAGEMSPCSTAWHKVGLSLRVKRSNLCPNTEIASSLPAPRNDSILLTPRQSLGVRARIQRRRLA